MKVHVQVLSGADFFYAETIADYVMDHDDPAQRRVLGEQCRNAFEGGQTVITSPVEDSQ